METAPVGRAPSPATAGSTVYRYRDASGRVAIVDSLERVPRAARASAEPVALTPVADASAGGMARALAGELHLPSFVAGASSALLVGLLLVALGRKLGRLLRGALVVGVVALGGLGYLGWVRRTTGQSSELVASPAAFVDDARAAVEKMNRSLAEQQRALQELEHER